MPLWCRCTAGRRRSRRSSHDKQDCTAQRLAGLAWVQPLGARSWSRGVRDERVPFVNWGFVIDPFMSTA